MLRARRNSANSASSSTRTPEAANSEDGPVSPRSDKWKLGGNHKEKDQHKHEEELKALQATYSMEIQQLRQQLQELEEHDRELTAQAEQEHGSMQVLVDQMEEMTAELNEKEIEMERARKADQETIEEMGAKLRALESQAPVMEKLSQFAAKQRTLEAENQTLREALEATKLNGGSTTSSSTDEANMEELKFAVSKLQKELEIAKEKQQNATKEHYIALAKATEDHNQELKKVQSQHIQDLELLDQENKTLQNQLQSLQSGSTKDSSSPDVQALQEELHKLRLEHANEMDEILAQLDLVEAEHAEQVKRLQSGASEEQHVMVHALTTELTTKTNQLQTLEARLSQAQQQLTASNQAVADWEAKYLESQSQFEQTLEEERRRTMSAADDAREEMINQAESQFEQANQMYMQLKQEYTALQTVSSTIAFKDLDSVQEVAMHDKQHFHSELERFQEVHDGLVRQLEEAQEAHRTLEKTLAMLVMEKETMAKENEELKGVCEETMALLENYQQQSPTVVT